MNQTRTSPHKTVIVKLDVIDLGDADPATVEEAMIEAAREVIREANPDRCFECNPDWGSDVCTTREHWVDPDYEYDAWRDRD